MDIHNNSSEEIIAFLKSHSMETELNKYEPVDLKKICDKIGLQRQGKVKLKKTFIKKIIEFISNLKDKDNSKYYIRFQNESIRKKILELIQDKIKEKEEELRNISQRKLQYVSEEQSEHLEDDSDNDSHNDSDDSEHHSDIESEDEVTKKEEKVLEDASCSDSESDSESESSILLSQGDKIVTIDTSELNNIDNLYMCRHENNSMVDHQEFSYFTKIIQSGKTTLVNMFSVYSQFTDDDGNSIKLGSIAYVDKDYAPLIDYINDKTCIIYRMTNYFNTIYLYCVLSGLVINKSSYREFEINQCNEYIKLTNNTECNILGIDRLGLDLMLERKNNYPEYLQFNYFIGKEWIDIETKKSYFYDLNMNEDSYNCYTLSKSLTEKNKYNTYRKCKFTLRKHKKKLIKSK